MDAVAYWIQGPAQSGKTARLVAQLRDWRAIAGDFSPHQGPNLLVFSATGDNRLALVDRLTIATGGEYPIQSTTPLAFFESEVSLFWPLLLKNLDLKPRFPLRLRPETEQELATQFWQSELTDGPLKQEGVSEWRLVRRALDLYLLAASSGTPVENIAGVLQAGMAKALGSSELWEAMGAALVRWRHWCLERGLLTYGVLTELYAQSLLPDPVYQVQLRRRFDGILADDVDEYPAIAHALFSHFLLDPASSEALSQGAPRALFTYNPAGAVRLGFGADPQVLEQLSQHCTIETLLPSPDRLAYSYGDTIVQRVRDAGLNGGTSGDLGGAFGGGLGGGIALNWGAEGLPLQGTGDREGDAREGGDRKDGSREIGFREIGFREIVTVARSQLLRAVADEIIDGVKSGQVEPQEIAVVGPGVDAIARYTLMEILGKQNIRLEPLTEQRPLYGTPMVRALLTLLAFVYPGLGGLLDPDQVAEMLVVLSLASDSASSAGLLARTAQPRIDAVRAGLLADYCYVPDPEHPKLLPMQSFPRWDRLGYVASHAYGQLLNWLETQKLQQEQRLTPSPLVVLDRAIQTFLWNGSMLAYDQLAALRELLEAAQHYWEVEARLTPEQSRLPAAQRQSPPKQAVERFILLLRGGTITANPYPVRPLDSQPDSVALATLFQYRINRPVHRWQFWLDAGSPLWLTSSGTRLFGAHLFTHDALADLESAKAESHRRALEIEEVRLENGLRDLLSHATERIYVCASELATNGQPQLGPLLSIHPTTLS